MSATPGTRGNRQGLALAGSDTLHLSGPALDLSLGARLEGVRTRAARDLYAMDESEPGASYEWHISPRLSVRRPIGDSFVLKGSTGRYLRIPTMVEMFGDRGFILGNSDLRSEVGWSEDLGLVWAPWRPRGLLDRIYVEAALFASQPDRPIVFVNRNGLVAQAINVEGSRVAGGELVASTRVARALTLTANYTYLDARNRSAGASYDKLMPGRPRHSLFARADLALELAGHLVVLWSDAQVVSGNYVDELNVYQLPLRPLLGGGVKLEIGGGLLAGLDVKNAGDVRSERVPLDPAPSDDLTSVRRALSDVHGYPLPGRAFYLNLQWNH
jgi:iron complex outermembrane receptor protein